MNENLKLFISNIEDQEKGEIDNLSKVLEEKQEEIMSILSNEKGESTEEDFNTSHNVLYLYSKVIRDKKNKLDLFIKLKESKEFQIFLEKKRKSLIVKILKLLKGDVSLSQIVNDYYFQKLKNTKDFSELVDVLEILRNKI